MAYSQDNNRKNKEKSKLLKNRKQQKLDNFFFRIHKIFQKNKGLKKNKKVKRKCKMKNISTQQLPYNGFLTHQQGK